MLITFEVLHLEMSAPQTETVCLSAYFERGSWALGALHVRDPLSANRS